MAGSKFTASIHDWKNKTQKAIDTVIKASAQDVANTMTLPVGAGGRMRVDTGFLRGSLVASTSLMPAIDPTARPEKGRMYPEPDVSMVILGTDFEKETLYLGFTASYSAYREYGANGVPPDGFVRMTAKQWPTIVDRNAKAFGVK